MVSDQLLVEVNQLIYIVSRLGTIPLVLALFLSKPALGISIEPNFEILSSLCVDSRCGYGILEQLEAFVDIIICVEESAIRSSLEGSEATLGARNCLLKSAADFEVHLVEIKLIALLWLDVKDEEEFREFDFASQFFATIQDSKHQLWHFVHFGSKVSKQISFKHAQERR